MMSLSRFFVLLLIISVTIAREENRYVEQKGGNDKVGCGTAQLPCSTLSYAFNDTLSENWGTNDTVRFRLLGDFSDPRTLNAIFDLSERNFSSLPRFWIGSNTSNPESASHFACQSKKCEIHIVGNTKTENRTEGELYFGFENIHFDGVFLNSTETRLQLSLCNFTDSARSSSSKLSEEECPEGVPYLNYRYSTSSPLLKIANGSFDFGCSHNSSGGALRIDLGDHLQPKEEDPTWISILSTRFSHNKSFKNGGAIFLSTSSASKRVIEVMNCVMVNNTAKMDGGAIVFAKKLAGFWKDSEVSSNFAKEEATREIACLESSDKVCAYCRTDFCDLCDGIGLCATSTRNEIRYCFVNEGEEMTCGGSSHKEIAYIAGILGAIFAGSAGVVLLMNCIHNRKTEYVVMKDEPIWANGNHPSFVAKTFD